MRIYYNNSPCGYGKTHAVIEDIVSRPGRYIYAVDRRDQIKVRGNLIDTASFDRHVNIVVKAIFSEGDKFTDGSKAVQRDVAQAASDLSPLPHCVLIVTHACMKDMDHSRFAGWEIVIDEDPCVHGIDTWEVPVSRTILGMNFDLVPCGEGMSQIVGRKVRATLATYGSDQLLKEDAGALERAVRRHDVFAFAESWADVGERLTWWRHWHLTALAGYAKVTIVANNFDRKLTYRLLTGKYAARYEVVPFECQPRAFQDRPVRIEYFANNHKASNYNFTTPADGGDFQRAVVRYVNQAVDPANHLVCVNLKNRTDRFRIEGTQVTSKIAGSNAHDDLTECTILYAAKASAYEARVLPVLDLKVEDVLADREYEDLIQVAMRTSLRVPDDLRPVTLRVYARDQAEMLAVYLRQSYGYTVDVVHVDVGAEDWHQRRSGPPTKGKKAMTGAERVRLHRHRKKMAQSRQAAP